MNREPVAYADAIRAVVVLLVALGWVRLDDTTVELVVTAVGAVISIGLTVWARRRVTPVRG